MNRLIWLPKCCITPFLTVQVIWFAATFALTPIALAQQSDQAVREALLERQAAQELRHRRITQQMERIRAQPRAPIQLNVEITEKIIDQIVFVRWGSAKETRNWLEWLQEKEILSIDQTCRLTSDQRQKLELAGRGDINRFIQKCELVKAEWLGLFLTRENYQQIQQQTISLRYSLSCGPVDRNCLLHKSLPNILEEQQIAQFQSFLTKQRIDNHSRLATHIVSLLMQNSAISADERREKARFIVRETKAPPEVNGNYDFHFVLLQLDQMPAEKLKPVFGDLWPHAIENHLTMAHALEPTLRATGYFSNDDEEPDGEAKPAAKAKN
jgi:hypothetical protein